MFSVTYENYEKNILKDKENKTLGAWSISYEMTQELKYAYVYLKNSEKMIVKKYEIERFERSNVSKGYKDEDKQCFIFKKSEDVFFEYTGSTIQGRHYQNSELMDALPRLEKSEIDRRLELSRTSNDIIADKKKSVGIVRPAQEKLAALYKKEYSDKKMPHFQDAKEMCDRLEQDPEQDLNALLDEYYLKEDKKMKSQNK